MTAVVTNNLTHHPDCSHWLDSQECDCVLTNEACPGLRPWSVAALEEWRRAVRWAVAQREVPHVPE